MQLYMSVYTEGLNIKYDQSYSILNHSQTIKIRWYQILSTCVVYMCVFEFLHSNS